MTADLEHLNQIWEQGWLKKDATLVEELMADEYLYIAPNGQMQNRQAILNIIRSPTYHLDSGSRTDVIVTPVAACLCIGHVNDDSLKILGRKHGQSMISNANAAI